MGNWWESDVTQGWGPPREWGVDLGLPEHTPVTALREGDVIAAGCNHPWGCEVDIATALPGVGPVTEYYIHLDDLAGGVGPGTHILAGQDVGISGGQLAGGDHPNSPDVSSGPHLEVGFFLGDHAWSGHSIDPLQVVRGGPVGGPGGLAAGSPSGQAQLTGINLPGISIDPWGGFEKAVTGTVDAGKGWVTSTAEPWAVRNVIALAVAAAIILVIFGSGEKASAPPPTVVPVPV